MVFGIRYMDESELRSGEFRVYEITEMVEDVVADERAGGVRQAGRHTCVIHRLDHLLHWHVGKVGGRTFLLDHLIDRLVVLIVRNSRVVDVDGDALHTHFTSAAGETD